MVMISEVTAITVGIEGEEEEEVVVVVVETR